MHKEKLEVTDFSHILNFLRPLDIKFLNRLAEVESGWMDGRQATGYQILPISQMVECQDIIRRCKRALNAEKAEHWDAYLIKYTDGTFVPPHKDPAEISNMRHTRINTLLKRPDSGGEFKLHETPHGTYSSAKHQEGDAIIFYPDKLVHEVTKVEGTRLVLSVGAWL